MHRLQAYIGSNNILSQFRICWVKRCSGKNDEFQCQTGPEIDTAEGVQTELNG